MTNKLITEQDLLQKISKLREHFDRYEEIDEGVLDTIKSALDIRPDDTSQAVKVNRTPTNYAKAQEVIANLEKAARYTGDDTIVRGRMGLPAKLPPFEQWDGTMPKGTDADWLTRNVLARSASKDIEAAGAAGQQTAQGQVDADARIADNYEKLLVAVSSLRELIKPSSASAPAPATLSESMRRLANLLQEEETASPTPSTELIKQINELIQAILADDPNPEADIQQAITLAQETVKAAEAMPVATTQAVPAAAPPVATKIDPTASNSPDKAAQAPADAIDSGTKPQTNTASLPGVQTDANALNPATANQVSSPYVVKPGDNLTSIAKQMGITLQDLLKANPQFQENGRNIDLIYPDEKVNPPGTAAPAPFQKELPDSTNGTYKNLDVSDPRIKALQAKVANDPNNASFNATIREDQSLARIVGLVNYGK